jgi:uncharacterized protein YbaR (Trm112 family)
MIRSLLCCPECWTRMEYDIRRDQFMCPVHGTQLTGQQVAHLLPQLLRRSAA